MRYPPTTLLFWLCCMSLRASPQEAEVLLPQRQWNLESSAEEPLLSVMGIAVLGDGSLAVSDKLSNALKRIDGRGQVIGTRRQRGTAPGAFNGPGPVAGWKDVIAVADFASGRVQLFRSDLSIIREFEAAGSVFALTFDLTGNLWVGALRGNGGETIFKYDTAGHELLRRAPQLPAGSIFDAIFHITCSRESVRLVYATRNAIERWDLEGSPHGVVTVAGFSVRARGRAPGDRGAEMAPPDILFLSCALDGSGRLALLAGDVGEHPRREVYMISKTGEIVALVSLPENASAIRFDDRGRLLAVEKRKTAISCYTLARRR
jgi:hypothetical protein